MTEAITTAEPQPPLTRLQRRALSVSHLMGCNTPPSYVGQLSRAELFDLLDSADIPTGAS